MQELDRPWDTDDTPGLGTVAITGPSNASHTPTVEVASADSAGIVIRRRLPGQR